MKFLVNVIFLSAIVSFRSSSAWEGKVVFTDDFEGDFLRKHYWDYEEGCGGNITHQLKSLQFLIT